MIAKKVLPNKVKIPNKRTIAAMEAARKGKVEHTMSGALKKNWKCAECGKMVQARKAIKKKE